MNDELRLYCIVRTDIDIPRPKAMVQSAHASTFALREAMKIDPDVVKQYLDGESQAKIMLDGKSPDGWDKLTTELRAAGVPHFMITDEGRTVFDGATVTCIGVGPVKRSNLPPAVRRLQLLKT